MEEIIGQNEPRAKCPDCGSTETIEVLTKDTGTSANHAGEHGPVKIQIPIKFSGIDDLKKQTHISEENIYDYFTNEYMLIGQKKRAQTLFRITLKPLVLM